MIKHCTRCRRKWSVSRYDTQELYICPDCEQRAREREQKPAAKQSQYKERSDDQLRKNQKYVN